MKFHTMKFNENAAPRQTVILSDLKFSFRNCFRFPLYENFYNEMIRKASQGGGRIWCQNDVVSTSMRRNHVVSTLVRRHFGTKMPAGIRLMRNPTDLQLYV